MISRFGSVVESSIVQMVVQISVMSHANVVGCAGKNDLCILAFHFAVTVAFGSIVS